MTQDENIIYQNVCGFIDDLAKSMKNMAEKAFEAHAVNCKGRNPLYVGLAYDVVAACMRWGLINIGMFVDSKENAIELSKKMERNFRTPEQDKEFHEKLMNTKF